MQSTNLSTRTLVSLILEDFLEIMKSIILLVILVIVNFITLFSSPIILTARPWKQNRKTVLNIIEKLANDPVYCKTCNHKYEGYAATHNNKNDNDNDNDNDNEISNNGFKKKYISTRLGKGYNDFQKASDILLSFRMTNNMPWAKMILSMNAIQALKSDDKTCNLSNAIVCTHVLSYGFWTINPCRIVSLLKESKVNINNENKIVTEVVISTRKGHLIKGEERFRIIYNSDKTVDFDMYSFTKGSGILGSIAMPLIRPLQDKFFKDNIKSMKSIMTMSQCEGNGCIIR